MKKSRSLWLLLPALIAGWIFLRAIGVFGSKEYVFELPREVRISTVVQLNALPIKDPLDFDQREEFVYGRPGRYDEGGSHHHYVEYILPTCRFQEHTSLDDGGINTWVEMLPNSMSIDDLLTGLYASQLDSDDERLTVYIKCPADRVYLNIQVQNRTVERICWLRLPHHLID